MKFSQFKLLVDMMFTPDEQGGIKTRYDGTNVRQMNPLVLAYVGDAFFHLFVRTRLLSYEQARVHALHAFSAQIVSAVWQHKAYLGIESMLTDEEKAIYRRGRNAKAMRRAARAWPSTIRAPALRRSSGRSICLRSSSACRSSARRPSLSSARP